jgi:hypothetical protein
MLSRSAAEWRLLPVMAERFAVHQLGENGGRVQRRRPMFVVSSA